MLNVTFKGVDKFNRAVFVEKRTGKRSRYFGVLSPLFEYSATEKDVLEKVTPEDLVYFGDSFGCEPYGTNPVDTIKIINK